MRRFDRLSEKGLYRSRNGLVLGVFRGLANHFGLRTLWLRAFAVLLLFASGLWPVAALYVLAAVLMKPEPVIPLSTPEEQEFYDSYIHSRTGAVNRLRRQFESIDRRIRRMEDIVTGREFDWDWKMNSQ